MKGTLKVSTNKPNSRNSALKILVCYHKPYTMPPNDDGILLPIQVGKALTDTDLHMQPDNAVNGQPCDNISHKHDYYSELTGLYWAWKNLKTLYPDVKYIGWTHYRRFFALNEQKYFAVSIDKPETAITDYRIDPDKVIKILESGRIIVPKQKVFSMTVAAQYCFHHHSPDYLTLKEVFMEKFPDYYDDFMHVMEANNKLSTCCMFMMKYDDFEKYCEWLFSVLAEVEPLIDYQHYNEYHKRVLAFITERLLDVYIYKNRIRTKRFNFYLYGGQEDRRSPLKKFLSCAKRGLIEMKCNAAMAILNLSFRPFRKLLKKFPLKP